MQGELVALRERWIEKRPTLDVVPVGVRKEEVAVDVLAGGHQVEPELANSGSAIADHEGAIIASDFDARGVSAVSDG